MPPRRRIRPAVPGPRRSRGRSPAPTGAACGPGRRRRAGVPSGLKATPRTGTLVPDQDSGRLVELAVEVVPFPLAERLGRHLEDPPGGRAVVQLQGRRPPPPGSPGTAPGGPCPAGPGHSAIARRCPRAPGPRPRGPPPSGTPRWAGAGPTSRPAPRPRPALPRSAGPTRSGPGHPPGPRPSRIAGPAASPGTSGRRSPGRERCGAGTGSAPPAPATPLARAWTAAWPP